MARQRQRLRLGGLALALALLLLLVVQNARGFSFVPASNPTARTRGGSAVVVMRAAGEPEQPVRPRTRRELASFDRRGAVRAGSALALGLAVLGSTGGISSSSIGVSNGSSSSAARAAVPSPLVAEPRPVDSHALEVADSTSTLLAAASEAEGADASSASSSRFMDFVSGLAGGAASRASKELLLHPLDTIRTRLQYAKGDEPPSELFKDLYDGVWPALIVGTPAGAAFFATKDVLKGYAKQYFGSEYRELTTIAAVFIANFPYWAIRNPAEVIKTQQQAGLVNGTLAAVQEAVAREGFGGLYESFGSNIAYAFPTDAIKFVVYESLQKAFPRKLNPLESSVCGSAASCVAQLLSTPLDVVRTRIMTPEPGPAAAASNPEGASVLKTAQAIAREEGVGKLFSGLAPRLTRAVLSGAIQFGSYELTKGAFSAPKK